MEPWSDLRTADMVFLLGVERRARGCAPPRLTARLAQRPEAVAQLFGEELRLLPGGEVAADGKLVEVDQLRIGALGPAARHLVQLVREGAHRHRDRHALRREVVELVLPVE